MLDVSGYPSKLWHRIIIDPSNPEKTNHHLGKFFESFNITNYDLNCYEDWVGKDGAVRVKHDNYAGSVSAKVIFCITRAYQTKLPAWGQPANVKNHEKPAHEKQFNNVPTLPNEHVQTVPPQRQVVLDGFKF